MADEMSRAAEETNLKLWPLWSPARPCSSSARILISGWPWSSPEHAQWERREKKAAANATWSASQLAAIMLSMLVSLELRFPGHKSSHFVSAALAASEGGIEPSTRDSNLHLVAALVNRA